MWGPREAAGAPSGIVVVLAPQDSVCVACTPLAAGERVRAGDREIAILQAVSEGHKIAVRAIRLGEKIVKGAMPIGSATTAIAEGDHVHTHNMKSDYLPIPTSRSCGAKEGD